MTKKRLVQGSWRPQIRPSPVKRARSVRRVATDRLLGSAVAVLSLVLSGTRATPYAEFGDSAETIAAVDVAGVAHAPGYTAYIAAAKAFSALAPVGELAARVNAFSAVCAAVATALLFVFVRLAGGGRIAAAAAAAAHAVGISTWFYSGYAKSYAFTTLLLVAALWTVQEWRTRRSAGWLLVAAALMGLSLGASYQAVAVCLPGLLVLVLGARRGPRPGVLAAAVGTGLLAAAAVVVYTMWRARTGPAVNWGMGTSLPAVVDLLTMRDFSLGDATDGGSHRDPLAPVVLFLRGSVILVREFGPLALLAPVGVLYSWRNRPRVPFWALTTIVVGNLAAVALMVRMRATLTVSEETVLAMGGFLLGAKLVTAVWIGLGAAWILEAAGARVRRSPHRGALPFPSVRLNAAALVGLLAITAGLHAKPASHRAPDVVAAYAEDMLADLPPDAVLFTLAVEPTFALDFAQVVEGVRPDVDIYRIPHLRLPWYREQAGLGDVPSAAEDTAQAYEHEYAETVRLSEQFLAEGRPVFLDIGAARRGTSLLEPLGMLHQGVVARATGTPGPAGLDVARAEEALQGYDALKMWDDLENVYRVGRLLSPYAAAHVELGLAYQARGEAQQAAAAFGQALRLDPEHELARERLAQLKDEADEDSKGTAS
jgi:hypothetical protein